MQKEEQTSEPLEYIRGFTEFLGVNIDLSQRPLIPRPETEFWVEKALSTVLTDKNSKIRCLDLFAGSGCIGLAVLVKAPFVLCDIADSQSSCIKQIRINCKLNNINKKRYKIIKSDVFSNIKEKYDYIFANPPYIPTTKKSRVQKLVLKYEPKTALFAGKDGLFYIKKFLKQAKAHLKPEGKIFMEFDSPQKSEIKKLVKKYDYAGCEFHRDQYGKYRWVVIT